MSGQMRWLIAGLLVANGAYYYWTQMRDFGGTESLDTSGERLVLVSELAPVDMVSPRVIPIASEPEPEPVSEPGTDASQLAAVAESLPVSEAAEPKAEEIEVAAEQEIDAEAAAQAERDALREQLVAIEIPSSVRRWEPPPAPKPEVLLCWRAGPLEPVSEAFLVGALEAHGLQPRLQSRKVVVDTKYWVYVDTADNADMRKNLRAGLLEQGIDNYVIAAGALAGDLSLGLFRERKRAQSVAAQRRQQGFPVSVYPVEKLEDRNWLLLDSRETSRMGWPEGTRHVPGRPQLLLEPVACEIPVEPELQGRSGRPRLQGASLLA